MNKGFHIFLVLLFTLNLTCVLQAQGDSWNKTKKIGLKPGLGFEYLSRTINWDEKEYTSTLKSYLFSLNLEFETRGGFILNLLIGYSSSNYEGMTFRQLPFSVALETGGIGGYLFGGEIEKSIFSNVDFEIALFGQFLYSLGFKKEWQITELNVAGTVEGRPRWMKAVVGPVFRYTGFDYFYPYLFVNYNNFWGKFRMNEKVQDLEGSENKEFYGEGKFGVYVGAIYELSESLHLKGEVSFIPFREKVDLGFMVKAFYIFEWRKS